MTKAELIANIAEGANISKKAAEAALAELTSIIVDRTQQGQDTVIHGFGTFKAKDSTERTGRNPKTGETVTIPARRSVQFKQSKQVRDSLN